ncbi:PTS fructose transporter subunit IIC [Escherichia albertii]|uniref:PTS fructose transporter subunit IIC n=1 Tax=Escherichia albertii TaxID=208962 RepID=UPI00235F9B12|nr:PTS fructose transporter subunit IIC [Escherichia albertii]WDB36718.1 PTS fructose transporter subunit IIC [Escherichia albertii]
MWWTHTLSLLKFAWLSQSFGGVLFGFAIPMFAAFVANSIGGKLAFPAGFIGGLMSTQPTQLLNFDASTMQWVTSAPIPSTFIGALIISIVAGYLVKWMNQKIQLPDFLLAFKTTFLLPILSAIFVILAMYYVITPFGGWINGGIRTILTAAGEKGALMYAMGIAAATAIDLGGPINKAAGFVAFSFTTDHVLPVTARSIAIVIPPIGLGLATIIDRRLTGKRLFNAQLYPQGKTAMFLAFMGISEGAIPFALESPITAIPSYMVGAIVGSTAAVWLGAVQWFPESAIWAWPLVSNLGVYMAGIALGAIITALMVVFLRLMMFRKGKLLLDSL